MKVGFTGTKRGMTPMQQDKVRELLTRLKSAVNWFHHGDCIGADDEAAAIAKELEYYIVAWPPINQSKRAFFKSDAIHIPMEYLDRNKKIVESSRIMIAAPGEREERLRSGTWSTIRYSLKVGRTIVVVTP